MSVAVAVPRFVGPRFTKWAWNMALDGAGEYDDETKTWTVPVEWEDSLIFPELKTIRKVYVREDRGEVFGSVKPF